MSAASTLPIGFVQDPGLAHVQYVVQQDGVIRVIENGVLRAQPFLDLSASVRNAGEQGLLGLAFPPDYLVSGRFYVHFSRALDGAHIVARFTRSDTDPFQANASSRFDLLWPAMPDIHSNCTQPEQRLICQPFGNHNGGKLAFGPDGYLYIAFGDGGAGNDPEHQAQRPGTLLGKTGADRRQRRRLGHARLRDSFRQPICWQRFARSARRDLGVRFAQPVAVQF